MLAGNHRLKSIEEKSMRKYEEILGLAKKTGNTGLVKTLFDSMLFKIPGCPFCHKPVRQNEVFCLAELFDTVFLAHVDCIEKQSEDPEDGGSIDIMAADIAKDAIDT